MVGVLAASARRAASTTARAKTPEPDSTEIPAAAPPAQERTPGGRRRQSKVKQLGRGYEYMDLEPEPTVTPSGQGAGPLGFAGTASKHAATTAAGLATLSDDDFGGSPRIPMMPSTWGSDSARIWETKTDDRRRFQQPQSSPRQDRKPCQIAAAAMPRPITGSNHQQPGQNAVTARPTRTAAACAPHK